MAWHHRSTPRRSTFPKASSTFGASALSGRSCAEQTPRGRSTESKASAAILRGAPDGAHEVASERQKSQADQIKIESKARAAHVKAAITQLHRHQHLPPIPAPNSLPDA